MDHLDRPPGVTASEERFLTIGAGVSHDRIPMAIEYQLDGDFALSKNLKNVLLHVRGSKMTEIAPPNDTMTFTCLLYTSPSPRDS